MKLFELGFRPFFLLAAVHAVVSVPLWLLTVRAVVEPGEHLDPVSWHAHEMLLGYTVAVMAGFLLTAARNWTKVQTARGGALAVLALLWLMGRVAVTVPGLPAALVAAVDLAFVPALAFAVGQALWRAGNRRNYVFVALLGLLLVANVATHAPALGGPPWTRPMAHRLALDVIVMVILVVTGRIVPAFTRNATGANVRTVAWLDRATLASMVALIVLDAGWPGQWLTGGVGLLTAGLAVARALGWGSRHTLREPLLWVLHVGYFWVPIGLALRGASALGVDVLPSAGVHALTAGAIGTLTLGMMARVTLGHTGRPLRATRPLGVAFTLVVVAGIVRVVAGLPMGGGAWMRLLEVSTTLWSIAFALYLLTLGPALFQARVDDKPGPALKTV